MHVFGPEPIVHEGCARCHFGRKAKRAPSKGRPLLRVWNSTYRKIDFTADHLAASTPTGGQL